MSFNVDIFNRQVQSTRPDYGTYSIVVTADLLPYATIESVNTEVTLLNTSVDELSTTTDTKIDSLSTTLDVQITSTNSRINSLSSTVNSNFLPLSGGLLTGNLTLSGSDGQDKSLILYSPTVNASAEIKAAITFIGFNPGTGQFEPEPGVSFPRILIREGRLDFDPDTVFTRAEFRVSNPNAEFNIYNKDAAKYYLRIRPNGGFDAGGSNLNAIGDSSHCEGISTTASASASHAEGDGTTASGEASHAEGQSTTASNNAAHAEGNGTVASGGYSHAEGSNTIASNLASHTEGINTIASGIASHAEGVETIAFGNQSHAAGRYATAAHSRCFIWKGSTVSSMLSTTKTDQFMVSAAGGAAFFGGMGIGTDSIDNALTVVGDISATGTISSSGAPVVVSAPQFETPSTNISAINNIVALTQTAYNNLTIKLPTTLYVIVSS